MLNKTIRNSLTNFCLSDKPTRSLMLLRSNVISFEASPSNHLSNITRQCIVDQHVSSMGQSGRRQYYHQCAISTNSKEENNKQEELDSGNSHRNELPLSHLRVLDLSRVLAGPYCTQLLADLGATVIKIEPPKVGDDTRTWGPPFMKIESDRMEENQSGYFQCANRNKKSLTINLKSKNGQMILHQLVKNSDILIENFKVGSLGKFGLDYKTAKSINPELIYCSITGYGQDSSKSHLPGYDYVMQALSGVMSITGDVSTPPFKVGVAITDVMTGMYATVGILSKVIEKQQQNFTTRNTGKTTDNNNNNNNTTGKTKDWIDLSLLDCNLAYLVNQATNYLQTGNSPKRIGNKHPNIAPYDLIKCRNGDIVVAVGNDAQFLRFISVISKDLPFKDLDKFTTNQQRVANRQQLIQQIEEITSQQFTKEDLIIELSKFEVPCGAVNTVGEALSDPQVTERNMIWSFENEKNKPVKTIGNPIKFIDENHQELNLRQFAKRPPMLSEHTDDILREMIGASSEEIEQWRREGTI